MQKIQLNLFADYFQFYIQDDDESVDDLSNAWTKEGTDSLMAVSDRVIGVGTVRNVDVPVFVHIVDELDPQLVEPEPGRQAHEPIV